MFPINSLVYVLSEQVVATVCRYCSGRYLVEWTLPSGRIAHAWTHDCDLIPHISL